MTAYLPSAPSRRSSSRTNRAPSPGGDGPGAQSLGGVLPLLLRRRGSLTEVLAVIAFTAAATILATVLGGVLAFLDRATSATESLDQQVAGDLADAALVAGALLIPSAVSLGMSAAKLSLARRERSLATIRLIGGTSGQVGSIAVLDVVVQATIGAIIGVVVHLILTPIFTQLDFGMTPFTVGELLLPIWGYPLFVILFVALAAASAAIALTGVVVSPLGVARGSRRARVSLLRGALWVVLLLAFVIANQLEYKDRDTEIALLLVLMLFVVGGLGLIGPLVVWLAGRALGSRTTNPSVLVAARRLAADPKGGWRSVSGITFGLLVAGFLSLLAALPEFPDARPAEIAANTGLYTGGYLTLAIAAVLAAVGTGVTQAARVLDQAPTYRSQHVSGAELEQLHRARLAEVAIPVVLSSVVALVSAMVLLVPMMGTVFSQGFAVLVQYLGSAIVAYALVAAAVVASAPLVRRAALDRL